MSNTDDKINHPSHYTKGGIEVINFIDSWNLGFSLGNCIKYITRANHKHESPIEDLRKARWYLNHEIERLEKLDLLKLKEEKENIKEENEYLKQQVKELKQNVHDLSESILMYLSDARNNFYGRR